MASPQHEVGVAVRNEDEDVLVVDAHDARVSYMRLHILYEFLTFNDEPHRLSSGTTMMM